MFSVGVRDHVMIAHSFRGEVFGPAQRLHGATFVVDVEFRRAEIDADGIVVDIGRAHERAEGVLAELNYRNLDELPDSRAATPPPSSWPADLRPRRDAIKAGRLGPGGENVTGLKVTLRESHVAWASFEDAV